MNTDCWFRTFDFLNDINILGTISKINKEFREMCLDFIHKKYNIVFQKSLKILCHEFADDKKLRMVLKSQAVSEWEKLNDLQAKISLVTKMHQNEFMIFPEIFKKGLYRCYKKGSMTDGTFLKLLITFDRTKMINEFPKESRWKTLFNSKKQFQEHYQLISNTVTVCDFAHFGTFYKILTFLFQDVQEIETSCEKFVHLCSLFFSAQVSESCYLPEFWNIYQSTNISDLLNLHRFVNQHYTEFQCFQINLTDQSFLWFLKVFLIFTPHPNWDKMKSNVHLPLMLLNNLSEDQKIFVKQHYLIQLSHFDETKLKLLITLSQKTKIQVFLNEKQRTSTYPYHIPLMILKEAQIRLYFEFILPLIKFDFDIGVAYEFVLILKRLTKDEVIERCFIISQFGSFKAEILSILLTLLPIELYQRLVLDQKHDVPIESGLNFYSYQLIPHHIANELTTCQRLFLYKQFCEMNETERQKFNTLWQKIEIDSFNYSIEGLFYLAKKLETVEKSDIKYTMFEFMESLATKKDRSLIEINEIYPLNSSSLRSYRAFQLSPIDNSVICLLLVRLLKIGYSSFTFLKNFPQISSDEMKQKILIFDNIQQEKIRRLIHINIDENASVDLFKLNISDLRQLEKDLFDKASNLYKICNQHLDQYNYFCGKLVHKLFFIPEDERLIIYKFFESTKGMNLYLQKMISWNFNTHLLLSFNETYLIKFFNLVIKMVTQNIGTREIYLFKLLQTLDLPIIYSFLDSIDNKDQKTIFQDLHKIIKLYLQQQINNLY